MKSKKIIIALILILTFLIIIVVGLIFHNRNKYKATSPSEIPVLPIDNRITEVKIRNNYYVAKTCLTKFFTKYMAINDVESGYKIIDEEAKKDIEIQKANNIHEIYLMLDKEYIEEMKITEANIIEKFGKIDSSQIDITHMFVSEQENSIYLYFVYGVFRDKKTNKISNFSTIVKIDALNRTFSIYLQDYIIQKYNDLKIGDTINIKTNRIYKNECNSYDYKNVSDEEYVIDLFNQYKEEILYNPELVYNNLDEEYRQKRFGTLDNFKNYTKSNISKNVIMQLKTYQKQKNNQYDEYICLDQKGNYYIFKETSTMKYTLILDTYTIDLPEFTEKYKTATTEEKVMLNIQKITQALNAKDYNYIYNKLAEEFKNNYFKTYEDFEKYAKETFDIENELQFNQYTESDDLSTYKITLKGKSKTITKTIVMRLEEGTNFVMSFNVN